MSSLSLGRAPARKSQRSRFFDHKPPTAQPAVQGAVFVGPPLRPEADGIPLPKTPEALGGVTCSVKFFSAARGYGFVVYQDIDVFLHRKTLIGSGISAIPAPGAPMVCVIEPNPDRRGMRVARVLQFDGPFVRLEDAKLQMRSEISWMSGWVAAKIKWFNRARGYGFAVVSGVEEDLYIHIETVKKSGLQTLFEGQEVRVRYGRALTGLLVTDIKHLP